MKRTIKFRAFDKLTQTMYVVKNIDFERETINTAQLIDDDGQQIYDAPFSDVNLMQYTGLQDKNGKEIYEGDILEEDPNIKSRFEVVWDKHWSRFKLDCTRVCNHVQYPEWNRGQNMKVIGNIYQHSNLLQP